jgi:enamine deaminase RidA (YjgF/YER057c/UK114 family)
MTKKGASMSNQAINPDSLFSMPGFHQVVTSTGSKTIHVAGQGAFDKQMNLVGPGDIHAQTVQAFQNLALALEAAGATPSDVVSSVMYIKGLCPVITGQFVKAMNEALDGKPFPSNASSLIGVDALADPRMLVEISAVAVIDE